MVLIRKKSTIPDGSGKRLHARVIMTAQHAKLLLKALDDNVRKFESKFGEIKVHAESPEGSIPFQPPLPGEKVH